MYGHTLFTDKPWGLMLATGKESQKSHHRHDYIWHRYNRRVCSGNGQCLANHRNGSSYCQCDQGYKGALCGETIYIHVQCGDQAMYIIYMDPFKHTKLIFMGAQYS